MPESFLKTYIPLSERLSPAVVSIIESILKVNGIEYLTVSGRVKSYESSIGKIKEKGYKNLIDQFTDLCGLRIILFSESDVLKVCGLIEGSFDIDKENSMNQDEKLGVDRSGYRSVHYVCKLGERRGGLPEFSKLLDLKFEIQIRTVLQHAWAELSHDRNYKFGVKLPIDLERRLHLYAALLEVADKGFDELSKSIDQYAQGLKSHEKLYNADIDSISLAEFFQKWAAGGSLDVDMMKGRDLGGIVRELNEFGVLTIKDLADLVPDDYLNRLSKLIYRSTLFGVVRDWMLIKDWRKYEGFVKRDWVLWERGEEFSAALRSYFDDEEFYNMVDAFSIE